MNERERENFLIRKVFKEVEADTKTDTTVSGDEKLKAENFTGKWEALKYEKNIIRQKVVENYLGDFHVIETDKLACFVWMLWKRTSVVKSPS